MQRNKRDIRQENQVKKKFNYGKIYDLYKQLKL